MTSKEEIQKQILTLCETQDSFDAYYDQIEEQVLQKDQNLIKAVVQITAQVLEQNKKEPIQQFLLLLLIQKCVAKKSIEMINQVHSTSALLKVLEKIAKHEAQNSDPNRGASYFPKDPEVGRKFLILVLEFLYKSAKSFAQDAKKNPTQFALIFNRLQDEGVTFPQEPLTFYENKKKKNASQSQNAPQQSSVPKNDKNPSPAPAPQGQTAQGNNQKTSKNIQIASKIAAFNIKKTKSCLKNQIDKIFEDVQVGVSTLIYIFSNQDELDQDTKDEIENQYKRFQKQIQQINSMLEGEAEYDEESFNKMLTFQDLMTQFNQQVELLQQNKYNNNSVVKFKEWLFTYELPFQLEQDQFENDQVNQQMKHQEQNFQQQPDNKSKFQDNNPKSNIEDNRFDSNKNENFDFNQFGSLPVNFQGNQNNNNNNNDDLFGTFTNNQMKDLQNQNQGQFQSHFDDFQQFGSNFQNQNKNNEEQENAAKLQQEELDKQYKKQKELEKQQQLEREQEEEEEERQRLAEIQRKEQEEKKKKEQEEKIRKQKEQQEEQERQARLKKQREEEEEQERFLQQQLYEEEQERLRLQQQREQEYAEEQKRQKLMKQQQEEQERQRRLFEEQQREFEEQEESKQINNQNNQFNQKSNYYFNDNDQYNRDSFGTPNQGYFFNTQKEQDKNTNQSNNDYNYSVSVNNNNTLYSNKPNNGTSNNNNSNINSSNRPPAFPSQPKSNQDPKLSKIESAFGSSNQKFSFGPDSKNNQGSQANRNNNLGVQNEDNRTEMSFNEQFSVSNISSVAGGYNQYDFPMKHIKLIDNKVYKGQEVPVINSIDQTLKLYQLSPQNVRRFKLSNLKRKNNLFENSQIQFGCISDLIFDYINSQNYLKLTVFVGNKTRLPIRNVSIEFDGDESSYCYIKQDKVIDFIPAKTQEKFEIIVGYKDVPFSLVNLDLTADFGEIEESQTMETSVFLPNLLTKYIQFKDLDSQAFTQKWNELRSHILRTDIFPVSKEIIKTPAYFRRYFTKILEMTSLEQFVSQQNSNQYDVKYYKLGALIELADSESGFLVKFNVRPDNTLCIQIISLNEAYQSTAATLLQHLRFLLQA